MKKFLWFLLLIALLAAPLPASSDEIPTLLTAEVTLVEMNRIEYDHMLTLRMPNGVEVVAYAVGHCRFFDSKNVSVSPEDFLKNYKGRRISIDFMANESDLPEYENIITECRGS